MGVGVEQTRALQHAGGVGQPHRVPVGLDLTGRGPAGTGTAVEILKRRRIQEERLKRHSFSFLVYHSGLGPRRIGSGLVAQSESASRICLPW